MKNKAEALCQLDDLVEHCSNADDRVALAFIKNYIEHLEAELRIRNDEIRKLKH